MRVLVAVDDSKFAEDLSRSVITQCQASTTEVLVLHRSLQPIGPPPPQMSPRYAPELEAENKLARELVERIAAELSAAGFKSQGRVEFGDVRESIIDYGSEWHADLIVVGSHGERGIQRFLLGSVSEFVARHARCSVEIVRAPTKI